VADGEGEAVRCSASASAVPKARCVVAAGAIPECAAGVLSKRESD